MNPAPAALDSARRRLTHAVAAVLGPSALEPALHAFMSGYRLALTVAGLRLLLGAAVAVTTLGRRAQSAPAGAR